MKSSGGASFYFSPSKFILPQAQSYRAKTLSSLSFLRAEHPALNQATVANETPIGHSSGE
jgi:hypothetical protein